MTISEVRESEPATVGSYAMKPLSEDGVKERMTEDVEDAEPSGPPGVDAKRKIEAKGLY